MRWAWLIPMSRWSSKTKRVTREQEHAEPQLDSSTDAGGVVRTAINSFERPRRAIGKATSVKPQAEGSHAGALSGGSDVYSKETICTGTAGQADMQFHDSSKLKVGPSSSVKLDKFVYDPNKSGGTVAIEATRGTFRFVTGSQGAGAYKVKTPYGTLGVRG